MKGKKRKKKQRNNKKYLKYKKIYIMQIFTLKKIMIRDPLVTLL